MNKKLLTLVLSLALAFSMPAFLSTSAAEDPKKISNKSPTITNINKLPNTNLKAMDNSGQVFISGKLSGNTVASKESALTYLEENKFLFGINSKSMSNNLKTLSVEKDSLGHTYVKFAQVINGLEVYGRLLNVHFDKNGSIVSVNGNINKNTNIETLGSKKISGNEACEIAKKQYNFDSLRNIPKAYKMILTKNNKNYEVFKVNISYKSPKIANYDVFVEATSGKVIQTENNIKFGDGATTGLGIDVLGKTKNLNLYLNSNQYEMRDVTKSATNSIYTYSFNNSTWYADLVSNDTNFFNQEVHKASVSAHYNAGKVIDFYKNLFNRNSLDNQGMVINSYTHYGYNYNNAFWDGYEMVYGDGDGSLFTYLSGDLDVVGHEMTHGVISNTANLLYHNQSGALNESMADVFGVLISTYNKYNVASGGSWQFNTSDWVVGDDIYTPYISGDALRSLSNPTLYNQPDHMSGYQNLPDTEDSDNGGVHINSGIPNKAAYNVAKNIGLEKTSKIYYRALVTYMTSSTDFADAKKCLIQAAKDLYGNTSTEAAAINNAYNSVGIVDIDDPYENNDTMDTAYPIELGKTYQSYISKSNDIDIYKFNTSTGNISINLWDLPYDYDLYLYDSNGQYITRSYNSSTSPETINYNVTTSGTYYILVDSYHGDFSTSQKYSLSVNKPVTGVNLNKSNLNLKAGDTTSIAATITPEDASNKNVTWESSNSTVAKVDNTGKIEALKDGTATITVTTEDGGYKAECAVSVALSPPASLKAESSSYNSIKTIWDPVSGATGYQIFRATSINGSYRYLATTSSTSYNNTNLSTNTTYYYKVRSYKTTGSNKTYSDLSSVVSAKPILSVPASVRTTSSSYNSIKTTWNSVSGATGYQIFRATSINGNYRYLATTSSTNYNNTNLSTNTTYYYKVRAYRADGSNKAYSDLSSVVSAKPILSVPASVRAASSSYNSIKTTWNSVSGAAGYQIFRATSINGSYRYLATTSSTNYNNTNLSTNTTYYYKVRAYRADGSNKAYSDLSSVVSAKSVLSVPSSVRAASSSYNSIKTTWNAVSDAAGYQIFRATSINGSYRYLATTSSTNYNNTNLSTNTTYYYKVRAYRADGSNKAYSDLSSVVSAKPILSVPASVRATSSSRTSIKTTWNAVSDAAGYQIFRATSINGNYRYLATTSGTSYNNTNLSTNTTYYYKVRAYKTIGSTKIYSDLSPVVSAKPKLINLNIINHS